MAGFSGTPLPKKLGIKDGFRARDAGSASKCKRGTEKGNCKCELAEKGPLDFVFLFVKTQAELKKEFSRRAEQLKPAGMFMGSMPKKSSGVITDLTENEVRRIGLEIGLVDVKVVRGR